MDEKNSGKKRLLPNHRLREERERRGWTHRDVADRINLPDSHTVSRWERGVSFPSAYYRQELCRIFGKSLQELDLLRPSSSEQEHAATEEDGQAEALYRLPAVFNTFVGREQEMAELRELLARQDVRLLTLLGTGGIGKTRLAIEVVRQMQDHFTDGVYFVSLASLRDPALVMPAIAETLGIRDSGALSLAKQLKAFLHGRHLRLLLDNFEQVIDAASMIEQLLEDCPHVTVLVTSRELLRLPAEHAFVVRPLALPDLKRPVEPEKLMEHAAVALFVQRAQAHLPTFHMTESNAHAIAELCVRLDGLPLAIELAAARIELFTPQTLLTRLAQGLHILKNDLRSVPDRHRTLYHTIKWSYDLLDTWEQWLFRHLALFAGGATLETMEAIFGGNEQWRADITEVVASLLHKSLILRTEQEHGEPRFTMLETIREYGLDCLRANGELAESQRTYALYYLSLVEQAAPYLTGSQQALWLKRLEQEQDNLRAALAWLIEQKQAELALRFCEVFGKFCGLRGYWREERRWLKAVLALPEAEEQKAIRARVLRRAGHLAYRLRDLAEARVLQAQSVRYSREVGDKQNLVGALSGLGRILYRQNEIATAGQLLEESVLVARQLDDPWALANALEGLGQYLHSQEKTEEAHALLQESVAIARRLVDNECLARILTTLVSLEIARGNLARARVLAEESVALAQQLGTGPLIALTLDSLGEVAMYQGAYEQAKQQFEQRIAMARELGDTSTIASRQLKLADIALARGEAGSITEPVEASLKLLREQGDTPGVVTALCILGESKRMAGDLAQARSLYQQALQRYKDIGEKRTVGRCLIGLAQLALDEGQAKFAAYLLGAAESWLKPSTDLHPAQRSNYERTVMSARDRLGETDFAQAWSRGHAASLEEILGRSE